MDWNADYIKSFHIRDYKLADWKYEKIVEQIQEFQEGLSESVDVLVQLSSFGSGLMLVEEIGFQNPDLLYFYGTVSGNKAQLIQHMTQLNFMLLAIPRKDGSEKPHRIGFHSRKD